MKLRFATIASLFFITLSVFQCNFRKEVPHFPSDFRFKIEAWGFSYISNNQTYVRSYVNGDTTIVLPLDESEIQFIYELVDDMKFLNFPDHFECAENSMSTEPSFTTQIGVGYQGRYNKCYTTGDCLKTEIDRPKQLEKLENAIRKILNSKSQVKNLPETDMVGL